MELWIRSQDKKHLMKCEAIMYEKTGSGYGLRVFTKNYDFNIANYKSEERALEVLDEIHNRIATLTTIGLMGVNDTNLMVFNKYLKENPCSVVYEMPKE